MEKSSKSGSEQLDDTVTSAKSMQIGKVADFYSQNNWTYESVASGASQYTVPTEASDSTASDSTASESTVSAVRKYVQNCATQISKAILSGSPPPTGVTIKIDALPPAVKTSLEKTFKISELVTGLGLPQPVAPQGTSINISQADKTQPLSDGVRLFVTIIAASYAVSEQPLRFSRRPQPGSSLSKYAFIFEVTYSKDELEAKRAQTRATDDNEKVIKITSQLAALLQQLSEGSITPEEYQARSKKLNKELEALSQSQI